jgi:hypothetical protein
MTCVESWTNLIHSRDIVGHVDLVFCEHAWTDTAGSNPAAMKTLEGFLLNEANLVVKQRIDAGNGPNPRHAQAGQGDQPLAGILDSLKFSWGARSVL